MGLHHARSLPSTPGPARPDGNGNGHAQFDGDGAAAEPPMQGDLLDMDPELVRDALARAHQLLSQTARRRPETEELRGGRVDGPGIAIDFAMQTVYRSGRPVRVTPTEFRPARARAPKGGGRGAGGPAPRRLARPGRAVPGDRHSHRTAAAQARGPSQAASAHPHRARSGLSLPGLTGPERSREGAGGPHSPDAGPNPTRGSMPCRSTLPTRRCLWASQGS
jgi:hypothetical protein